ncbi:DUF1707 SHOCT-like domain-containing protein [Mycolicibacterium thermoresistibile]|jgi:hypothetical protein|uniref:DUF1707 domain-containing protein n=2 Tax=Mycolicibacterium thermoresistibile TaxID=1797 RepID=G7CGP0_MYCT3|nr:DUF1707 domain-containing protein [Mycolicibacterium thermoresistibile]EHI12000.1 hypothetical protein KEK_13913 [Mycolicibacterium thermoresistibile ATCC 19527]MCV7188923.1 DUF1707 domain-containing protein [Mycolicibacterium thermoresistibile]GAT14894.1 putative uncharacterized protein [Mycolicibacterium thermoresistibile]SNW20116.1 protein of uncharacterised function (DUF1707) [Mycolicibacterium thermoresistibile]
MDSGHHDAHLRASDADRAAVRQLLERAVGEGMLTLDEYTERVDVALAARTRGELDKVLADLPMARRPDLAQSTQPLLLRGRFSTLSRKGEWSVPARVVVDTRMCDTTLDFTVAMLRSPVVHVDIDDYLSTTTLILPDGATGDVNAVETFASTVNGRVPAAPPSQRLHLVIRGRVRLATVTVRYSFGAAWRRFTGRSEP